MNIKKQTDIFGEISNYLQEHKKKNKKQKKQKNVKYDVADKALKG